MWKLLILVPFCCCAPRIPSPCEDDSKNFGTSAGYRVASEMLTKSINFSVDPCMDFFEFTCGNWIANHPIPSHKTSYSQFGNLSDKVQEEMRGLWCVADGGRGSQMARGGFRFEFSFDSRRRNAWCRCVRQQLRYA
ncbi:hypothetical protein NECAME_17057 [Necator americanus]|uniref:Peptidase M13 N-terminal domain-containing protein n=1 Tax=Necator americanus TaxID=51031 RepID=W2TRH4_NECAM|nr:hypothetical protein NECAME_17057 [Necator americanus]ETN84655.1 hypothetical protein NECAME_17057 [Necator americanus]